HKCAITNGVEWLYPRMQYRASFCRTPVRHFLLASMMLSVGCIEFDRPPSAKGADELSQPGKLMPVCDREFVVHDGTDSMALLYCATDDVQGAPGMPRPQYPDYVRLVIAHHGRGSKAREYYKTLTEVAADYRER